MQAQLTTLSGLDTSGQQTPIIEIKKEIPVNKKKTLLRIKFTKIKLFFWNLSPLHWYDGFKVMKFNMDEFMCKKPSATSIDKSETADKV
jgi:hypothetical protein